MKPLYTAILKLYEEFKEDLAKEGRSYAVDYTIDAVRIGASYFNIKPFHLIILNLTYMF